MYDLWHSGTWKTASEREREIMSAYQDPGALRRRLQRELRRYRSEAGMTQASVAGEMDWSPSKVIRIESGQVAVSTNDLKVLLSHYGVKDPAVVAGIIELSKASRLPSRWAPYEADKSISSESADYFANESAAAIIRQYEYSFLPGLLQTTEYMYALFSGVGGRSGKHLEGGVAARLLRQKIFEEDDLPKMFFIIDEAILRRQFGGPDVMKRQLAQLQKLAEHPQVTIQIVPTTVGAYPGLIGPFTILEFTDDDPVLYLESRTELVTRESPSDIGAFLDIFQTMERETATKPDELNSFLAGITYV
jgi:transcriptional regulator with XRE-family HTH domain